MVISCVLFTLPRSQKPRHSHALRYVLRNKKTEDVYLVVVFTVYPKEEVNEDGTLKEGAGKSFEKPAVAATDAEEHDRKKALQEAKEQFGPAREETNEDDVD